MPIPGHRTTYRYSRESKATAARRFAAAMERRP